MGFVQEILSIKKILATVGPHHFSLFLMWRHGQCVLQRSSNELLYIICVRFGSPNMDLKSSLHHETQPMDHGPKGQSDVVLSSYAVSCGRR